jgi:hypothetical protein
MTRHANKYRTLDRAFRWLLPPAVISLAYGIWAVSGRSESGVPFLAFGMMVMTYPVCRFIATSRLGSLSSRTWDSIHRTLLSVGIISTAAGLLFIGLGSDLGMYFFVFGGGVIPYPAFYFSIKVADRGARQIDGIPRPGAGDGLS